MKWDGRIEITVESRPGIGGEGALKFHQRDINIFKYRLTFPALVLAAPQGVNRLSGGHKQPKRRVR